MKKFSLLLLSASLLLSATNSFASTNKKMYFLKGDTVTGTRIKAIDATSNIPFNKAYDELNTEQQSLIKAKFHNLGLNDIPPFPKDGLASVYKPIIEANKAFGTNTSITVNATIASNGLVNNVEVLNATSPEFINYVTKTLSSKEFKAASCNGVNCEMNFPIVISFN